MLQFKRNLSAVILDMDGLMFDTERIAIEAWQRAGHECNCEIPEALIVESVGRDINDTRALFEKALGSSLDFNRARILRVKYAADIVEQRGVPIKDGLLDLLDMLTNYSVLSAVATSTERSRAEHLLLKAQVSTLFDVVVCGDEVRRGKPAPDIFLLVAKRLGVNPNKCIVLEDSESGVLAAAKAHMHCFMVPDIKPPSTDVLVVADKIFPNLYAVASHLSGVFAAD